MSLCVAVCAPFWAILARGVASPGDNRRFIPIYLFDFCIHVLFFYKIYIPCHKRRLMARAFLF
jgi:hypothetical protein